MSKRKTSKPLNLKEIRKTKESAWRDTPISQGAQAHSNNEQEGVKTKAELPEFSLTIMDSDGIIVSQALPIGQGIAVSGDVEKLFEVIDFLADSAENHPLFWHVWKRLKGETTSVQSNASSSSGDPAVDHPKHYNAHPSGVECITVIEQMNFNMGNAIKYIWRADEKGNAIQDLEKARWSITREIERRKSLKGGAK